MKDIRKYLLDILIVIDDLESFAQSFTLGDLSLKQNQWAVERGISIIGEAAYQLWKLDKTLLISNWQQIMGTRHIIVHDYDRVEPERLLVILRKHLPILKTEIESIITNLS
jgi:uncharacterized protein with HEPN domain